MTSSLLSTQQKLIGGAALVIAVSAFLPWVSVLGISAIGVEGDGVITLVAALLALGALASRAGFVQYRVGDRLYFGVVGAAAAVCLLVALIDMNSFAAIGLYLTLFGSIALAAGIVWELTEHRRAAGETPESAPAGDPPA